MPVLASFCFLQAVTAHFTLAALHGYEKVPNYDCSPSSYLQIRPNSTAACKAECDSNSDCCGFGHHYSGYYGASPMCEFRSGDNCGSCYEYSDGDYYFKEGHAPAGKSNKQGKPPPTHSGNGCPASSPGPGCCLGEDTDWCTRNYREGTHCVNNACGQDDCCVEDSGVPIVLVIIVAVVFIPIAIACGAAIGVLLCCYYKCCCFGIQQPAVQSYGGAPAVVQIVGQPVQGCVVEASDAQKLG